MPIPTWQPREFAVAYLISIAARLEALASRLRAVCEGSDPVNGKVLLSVLQQAAFSSGFRDAETDGNPENPLHAEILIPAAKAGLGEGSARINSDVWNLFNRTKASEGRRVRKAKEASALDENEKLRAELAEARKEAERFKKQLNSDLKNHLAAQKKPQKKGGARIN